VDDILKAAWGAVKDICIILGILTALAIATGLFVAGIIIFGDWFIFVIFGIVIVAVIFKANLNLVRARKPQ
jgi:hypothetical protein